jgi:hypothetical protein
MAENHKVVKVAIAIPNNGYTQVESYENRLLNFLHLGRLAERSKNEPVEFDFYFFVIGRTFTPMAREEAVKNSLEAGMDYLWMIDDDMIADNDIFERLYRHDVDIVGGLAFTRNPPFKPVIYSCIDGWDPIDKKDYFINHYIMNYPKDKLVECDAFGFGTALIKMDVFRKMKPPYFALSSQTGEDILFCYNAKKYGFKVYVDTSTKLGHLGNPIKVTEDSAHAYWKESNLQVERHNGEYIKYKTTEVS